MPLSLFKKHPGAALPQLLLAAGLVAGLSIGGAGLKHQVAVRLPRLAGQLEALPVQLARQLRGNAPADANEMDCALPQNSTTPGCLAE